MSNFFERELGRVFGDGQVIRDPTYSGFPHVKIHQPSLPLLELLLSLQ